MLAGAAGRQLRDSQRFQRLKASFDLTVHDLLAEVGAETGCEFSPETCATISELVVEKAVRAAGDLQAFAGHARRQAVAGEDVRLLTRRNQELNARLTALSREQAEVTATKRAAGRAKRAAGRGHGAADGEGEGEVARRGKPGPSPLID